jgi:hypothetical protein
MYKNINERKFEKGQTLLFVVVAVTIALSVGIAVSTRTISSLRRVSRTDSSTRVIAAAEGGIENMLGRNFTELDAAIGANDCGAIGATQELIDDSVSSCVYNFTPTEPDIISSRAVVSVEKYNSNIEGSDGYSFDIVPGEVMEIALSVGTDIYEESQIEICWENRDSAIYYYSYNPDGEARRGGLYDSGFPYALNLSGRFTDSGVSSGPQGYCKTVDLVSDAYGLRIKVLYDEEGSNVAVFPTGTEQLPVQGYLLTSRGEIMTGEESEERATVIVRKSYPFPADIFDYGIYTPVILD